MSVTMSFHPITINPENWLNRVTGLGIVTCNGQEVVKLILQTHIQPIFLFIWHELLPFDAIHTLLDFKKLIFLFLPPSVGTAW